MYNPDTGVWEDETVIANNIPNTGNISVTVPAFDSIDSTSIHLIQVKVSSSISIGPNTLPTSALPTISRSTISYLIKSDMTDIAKRSLCDIWHRTTININQDTLPPCPCNTLQAQTDDRYTKEKSFQLYISNYFFRKFKATSCYRQTNTRYIIKDKVFIVISLIFVQLLALSYTKVIQY